MVTMKSPKINIFERNLRNKEYRCDQNFFLKKTFKLKRCILLLENEIFYFFFFLTLNFNLFLHDHMRGIFSYEQEAAKRSLELGCKGTRKN